MYEGGTDVEEGKVLGHENMGEVIAVGDGVDRVKVGDVVVLPFNIGCGFCKNCESGLTGFCLTANPGHAGAAYGYADMGPYNGGQAELLRVPYADWNALILPDSVVVWGAGAAGLGRHPGRRGGPRRRGGRLPGP